MTPSPPAADVLPTADPADPADRADQTSTNPIPVVDPLTDPFPAVTTGPDRRAQLAASLTALVGLSLLAAMVLLVLIR